MQSPRRNVTMSADRGSKHDMMEGATVSARLITSVLFLTGLGWLIDSLVGTWPWLTGLGAVAGGALGFYLTVLHAKEAHSRGR